jgi:hypothetical protein
LEELFDLYDTNQVPILNWLIMNGVPFSNRPKSSPDGKKIPANGIKGEIAQLFKN